MAKGDVNSLGSKIKACFTHFLFQSLTIMHKGTKYLFARNVTCGFVFY